MRPFTLSHARSIDDALTQVSPGSAYVAGGTELINWMKDGIASPERLIDISEIDGLDRIEATPDHLYIGALARMSDVAADEGVWRFYRAISLALTESASPQLRNLASVGGNLLQRTRCPYFRAEIELPCNKRRPGSGCSALGGEDREAALFGWSEACVATHPSDLAVALAALDAKVITRRPSGSRTIALTDLYRLPDDAPECETTLDDGELIVGIEVTGSPRARRSHYLKVRDRASYEFAVVSAAVGVELDGQHITAASVALGGVALRPWRLAAAEEALIGVRIDDPSALGDAITLGLAEARPRRRNGFKIALARGAVMRALQRAGASA